MRRGRDPSRTPSRPRRPVWDNPRGQLPGTGIRSDGGNLYGGSAQGVSGTSSGGVSLWLESHHLEVVFQWVFWGVALEEPLLVDR